MFNSLKTQIVILIIVIPVIILLIITYYIQGVADKTLTDNYNKEAKDKLQLVSLHVENEYESITFFKEKYMERRKKELENIVNIGMGVIKHNYSLYKSGKISEKEAKALTIASLRDFTFDDGIGYVWLNDTAKPLPHLIMHPLNPELENIVLNDPKFYSVAGTNQHLLQAFVDVCRTNGEGFVEYIWPKPRTDSLTFDYKKISYVRSFRPWGWIIGTGAYLDDIDADTQKRLDAVLDELRNSLSKTTIIESGYLFIFSGDCKMLVHPNLPQKTDLSSYINGLTGNKLIADLMEASKEIDKPIVYSWIKTQNEGVAGIMKSSYVNYFEPLDWYICSSVSINEINIPLKTFNWKLLIMSILVLITGIIVSVFLLNRITKPISKMADAALEIMDSGVANASIPVEGVTESKNLGIALNKMLSSIKLKQQQLLNDKENL